MALRDGTDSKASDLGSEAHDTERRAALRAIAKYAGAAGATATLTVLSAEQVVAEQPCSAENKGCAVLPPNKPGNPVQNTF